LGVCTRTRGGREVAGGEAASTHAAVAAALRGTFLLFTPVDAALAKSIGALPFLLRAATSAPARTNARITAGCL